MNSRGSWGGNGRRTGRLTERRRGPRVGMAAAGRVQAVVETRLIDLSATGARIGHANLLTPGCVCVLELPAALGGAALAARVVRTVEVGTGETEAGAPSLRYESGLAFADLAPDQRDLLMGVLDRLAGTRGGSREH